MLAHPPVAPLGHGAGIDACLRGSVAIRLTSKHSYWSHIFGILV